MSPALIRSSWLSSVQGVQHQCDLPTLLFGGPAALYVAYSVAGYFFICNLGWKNSSLHYLGVR